jgi:hypothetical protein
MTETASSFLTPAIAILLLIGLIRLAVGPTLVGRRRRRRGTPLPHLASGPLTPIVAASYPAARRSRFVHIASIVTAALAAVLLALAGAGTIDPATGGLGLASAIIAVTFAFSNWFAGRVRIRVDEVGIHGRVLFGDHTVRWTQVSDQALRYVFMPGFGVRMVYYTIRSPTTEVAFPSSLTRADQLRRTIEAATGVQWAAPEIEANF